MTNKKRFIVFILVFIFSFNMIFYSPSDDTFRTEPVIVNAEPITMLTTGLILAICALLAACGIIITTPDMARDIGQLVYDAVKDIPGAITQVGDKIKFNLVAGVLDAVKGVVSSLPSESTTIDSTKDIDTELDDTGTVSTLVGTHDIDYNTVFYLDCTGFGDTNGYLSAPFPGLRLTNSDGKSITISLGDVGFTSQPPATKFKIIFMDGFGTANTGYISAFPHYLDSDGTYKRKATYTGLKGLIPTGGLKNSLSNMTVSIINSQKTTGSITCSQSVDIPYSPDTTKDVDYETKPKEWFPSLDNPAFGGSISVPINQPLPNISVDAPIIFGDDFVADNDISIDSVDTSLPDNSVDSDSVLDKILDAVLGFFTGFWDTFSSLLDGLLAPIVGLLNWIYELLKPIIGFFGDILKFLGDILSAIIDGVIGAISSLADLLTGILDFLLSLVDALIDALVGALEGLFVPTIDISKAFEIPEDTFVPIGDLNLFDLFNITPKPIRFSTVVTFGTITYPIKLYLDEISVITDNITLIRNLFSYTLLLVAIYGAISMFKPKRVMD
jgi:hypothetical protein